MVQLQQLEEERLKELHKYLTLYKNAMEGVPPQMTTVNITSTIWLYMQRLAIVGTHCPLKDSSERPIY